MAQPEDNASISSAQSINPRILVFHVNRFDLASGSHCPGYIVAFCSFAKLIHLEP